MDPKTIAEQAKERARIALEQVKLEKDEAAERKRQEEEQRERDDYPDILRANIVSGLVVENSGDYTEDLAAFQKAMRELIATVPKELLLQATAVRLSVLLRQTVEMLSLKPSIPLYLQKDDVSDDDLQPYIDRVVAQNLKARTFAELLAEVELRDRVYATCAPATIDARLSSLAAEIEKVKINIEDSEAFKVACRNQWTQALDKIVPVNESGYVQSGGNYVVHDRCVQDMPTGFAHTNRRGSLEQSDGGDDMVYFLARYICSSAEKGQQSFFEFLKPRLDILRPWAEAIEARVAETGQSFYPYEHPAGDNVFGYLVHHMENFGVWSTGQCIDTHRRPYYLGDLTDSLLEVLDEYAKVSPMAAGVMLATVSHWIGSTWGYNCPEESLIDNSKEPELYIELLKSDRVKEVLTGDLDTSTVLEQFVRLFKAARRFAKWQKGWRSFDYYWDVSGSTEDMVQLWDAHREDAAYWEKKSDDETQSAS